MTERPTINIRGVDYEISSLIGDFQMSAILAIVDDVSNPKNQAKTAAVLKNTIEGLPDTIVSEKDGAYKLHLWSKELAVIVNALRKQYFIDNVELARQLKDYDQEKVYTEGLAAVLAELDLPQDKTIVKPSKQSIKDKKIALYEEQIAIATNSKDSDRVAKLKEFLAELNDAIEVTPHKLAIDSEKEELREQVKTLQQQLKSQNKDSGKPEAGAPQDIRSES